MTRQRTLIGTVAAAAAATLALGQSAVAGPSSDPEPQPPTVSMMSAMQRDLGLTAGQAKDRVAAEKQAARTAKDLGSSLGSAFGGAWFDAGSATLRVAVTDAASAAKARARGVEVREVERSQDQLDAYVERLDAARAEAPAAVPGWYVDVEENVVVVQTRGEADAAEEFAEAAGVPAAATQVQRTPEKPQPLAQGGDAYYIGGARCSIGFAVTGGFVTAGHCGATGAATQQPSGTFQGSSFPGNDYAYVSTSTTIAGSVNDWSGGSVAVRGSTEAAIGSSICRSGSTTGWRCGTIQARNATVNYAEGSVTGLIRTSACAEPGDSGGSALSGNQAQGVTSGGSGSCLLGGTTYFQPVNEILSRYGLTLRTS